MVSGPLVEFRFTQDSGPVEIRVLEISLRIDGGSEVVKTPKAGEDVEHQYDLQQTRVKYA